MSDPTLTPPPTAPAQNDGPDAFNSKAFPFFGWFAAFVSEMTAAISWVKARATEAVNASTSATASKDAAASSATSASGSASSASSSATTAVSAKDAAVVAKNAAEAAAATAIGGGEPAFPAGTTSQFFRGDKTWYVLPLTTVGTAGAYTLSVGGNLDISGAGKKITADFSNADLTKRAVIQTNAANSNTSVVVTPTGTGTNAYVSMSSNPDQTNCSLLSAGVENGVAIVNSTRRGSGAFIPLSFFAGGEERMRLEVSGRVSVTSQVGFGYGPGAGGTVTQSGNKTATVTLNKASGQITLFASTLDVNGAFLFSMDNSSIGAEDTVIANMDYTTPDAWMYSLTVAGVRAGSVIFRLHNREGPAKTAAEKINFVVIKGARA